MFYRRAFGLIVALLVAFPGVAAAAPPSVDLSAGTAGAAIGVLEPLGDGATDVRLGFNTFAFDETRTFSNQVIDVTADIQFAALVRPQAISLTGDRYVRGSLFVSAGIVDNRNRVTAVSVPANTYVVIDGRPFARGTGGAVNATAAWPALAPYLGFGFASPPRAGRRVEVFVSAGAFYEGTSRTAFTASGTIGANVTKFQPYFDAGRSQLARLLAPAVVYPAVQVGTRIRL